MIPSFVTQPSSGSSGVSSVTNSDGTIVISPTTGAAVISLAALPSGDIFVGNASNIATAVAVSGDLTLANTGAFTVAKIAGVAVGTPTGTGNVVFSASPTFTGTVTAATITASGAITTSVSPAVSNSAILASGTILTGGSGTTNFPAAFIQPSGAAAVTTWSTAGTAFGVNTATGFTGNFLDFHVNGGTSVFNVASTGDLASAASLQALSSAQIRWSGRTRMVSPADGILQLWNTSQNGFTGIKLGGTTSSFPYLKVNGTGLSVRVADDTADSALSCSALTISSTTMLTSAVALTNNAAGNAGTLTNAPAVGNPTKWIPINDNGTTRNIPAW